MKARLGDRSLFPTLQAPLYLDHAAVGPPPAPAVEAAKAVIDAFAAQGTAAIGDLIPIQEAARAGCAALIGAEAADVALLGNTSAGVSAVAWGLDWRPGDRILLFGGEFPANVTPWQRAAEQFELELAWVPCSAFLPSPGPGLDAVEAELKRGLRLVAVSAVQFQTGLRMPLGALAALCHDHGAELFVDGIQAVGSMVLDAPALGIDYLAAGGHKWMHSTFGTGMLWARDWARLQPRLSSWLSHRDPLRFLMEGAGRLNYDQPIDPGPATVEGGVWNGTGQAALAASTAILNTLGLPAIEAHLRTYLDRLEEGLQARGFVSLRSPERSGQSVLLCVAPPVPLLPLAEALRARGLAISTPDGHLRFAPHWPNGHDEVPRILAAVDAALSRG